MSDIKEVDFFFLRRMLRHDFDWYEALFSGDNTVRPKEARGEISPGYARLKLWQVKRIAELLPQLRIILILRHPIERTWSQTLYTFGHLRRRDVRDVSSLELLRQLERERSKLSSDYFRIVRTWSSAFGREALHIGFFEQLRNEPQKFVDGVLKHIGLYSPWLVPEQFLNKKVFATTGLVKYEREIPGVVHWYIANQLLGPTERLNELLNGSVSNWVADLRVAAGKTRPSWRILREVNRSLLAFPERAAYEAYHAALDARMWLRWRQLQTRSVSDVNLNSETQCTTL